MGRKVSKRKAIPELGVDPRKLATAGSKTLRLGIRVSPEEKRAVEAMARRLKVTASDYVLGLHQQAVDALRGEKGGRSNG